MPKKIETSKSYLLDIRISINSKLSIFSASIILLYTRILIQALTLNDWRKRFFVSLGCSSSSLDREFSFINIRDSFTIGVVNAYACTEDISNLEMISMSWLIFCSNSMRHPFISSSTKEEIAAILIFILWYIWSTDSLYSDCLYCLHVQTMH